MRATFFLLLAACAATPDDGIVVQRVTPEYGPMSGGSRVLVEGYGFGGQTAVFIGGREAPEANAIDANTIEVLVPPGDRPGDAELIVLSDHHNSITTGQFRYSTEPAVTTVSPAEVIYQTPQTMTVTGSGFLDEGAGDPLVLVDGVPAMDATVVDDTTITFTVAGDKALGRPRVEVSNLRGLGGKERAFRYRPSVNSGLLLFAPYSGVFAVFVDPVAKTMVQVPLTNTNSYGYTTVYLDDHGEYWGIDRGSRFGRVDLGSQKIEQFIQLQSMRIPAMARVGDTLYGFNRYNQRFGSLGLDGVFRPIGTSAYGCCGSWGIAFNGSTLYFTSRSGAGGVINTIDPATGAIGTPVAITAAPGFQVEEMRFFRGTLYAVGRDATLVAIDPTTGTTSVVMSIGVRTNAMEVFE